MIRTLMIAFLVALAAACTDGSSLGLNGDSCEVDSGCESGFCLLELGTGVADDPITFDGGYCTHACFLNTDTNEADGCEEDELCLFYDPNPWDDEPAKDNYCYTLGCETDWDCRDESYVCMEFGFPPFTASSKACVPYDAETSDKSYPEYENVLFTPALE